jgi:hypothetical protein
VNDVIVRGAAAHGLGYPSGHAAVSFALTATAVPFLARRCPGDLGAPAHRRFRPCLRGRPFPSGCGGRRPAPRSGTCGALIRPPPATSPGSRLGPPPAGGGRPGPRGLPRARRANQPVAGQQVPSWRSRGGSAGGGTGRAARSTPR